MPILWPPLRSGTEVRTSDTWLREPEFESCAAILNLGEVLSLYIAPVPAAVYISCINEYVVIDSGGYLFTISLPALVSVWPDVSQRSWNGVWSNRSAGSKVWSSLSSHEDCMMCYISTYLYVITAQNHVTIEFRLATPTAAVCLSLHVALTAGVWWL